MNNRRHLYHARISRRLTLEQIGLRTALSPTVLRNIDNGRFDLLPSGVYARSYVRTFASAVGVDPEEALAEVEELLPGAPDPIALLHEARAITPWERAGRRLSEWRQSGVRRAATLRARLAEQAPTLSSALDPRPLVRRLEQWPGLIRPEQWLRWPPADGWPSSVTRQRFGAAGIDAALLLLVDAFLVMLVSWSSGISVGVLVRDAGLALAAFCAIPIALYFLLFGGIAGSTLGQHACHLIQHKLDHPLTLPDILRRAVRR
jgi:hypothetical protein